MLSHPSGSWFFTYFLVNDKTWFFVQNFVLLWCNTWNKIPKSRIWRPLLIPPTPKWSSKKKKVVKNDRMISCKGLSTNNFCHAEIILFIKACVCYFSLFLKDKCISLLFRTKHTEKKFNLQLFFLPTVLRTFILSWATTRYLPSWNFLFRKNNCMCNRDNAHDIAACSDE